MKAAFCFFVTLSFLCSCSENKGNDNVYNEQYQIGAIPDLKSFETLNKNESNLGRVASDESVIDYKNNRFRLFLNSFSNGQQIPNDSAFKDGFSSLCESRIEGDSLKVIISVGFFSGVAVEIDIFKNNFQSFYDINNDDVKSLKYNLSDKDFAEEITLKNKFQALILNEKPSFKPGQQLTGYLTFTSPVYFSKHASEPINSGYVTGKVYFTCKTQ